MMEIISQFPTPGAAGQPAANTPAARGTSLNSDFETFLKMLTTQMQNQDPLNPVDSADFAVQLATFSTVEQQVMTNDLLSALGDQLGALGVAQLSGWIGMEARTRMPVQFSGTPVTVTVHAASGADSAQLVARDTTGAVAGRQNVAPESGAIAWPGTNTSGTPLPPGTYALSLESYIGGELIGTTPVETHDRIVEARSENGQTILVMDSGQEVAARDVLGLREPSD